MANQYICDASFKTNTGAVAGPVVLTEDGTYLFRNTLTDADLYFEIQKEDGQWVFVNGFTTVVTPQEWIDTVGRQIDVYLNS